MHALLCMCHWQIHTCAALGAVPGAGGQIESVHIVELVARKPPNHIQCVSRGLCHQTSSSPALRTADGHVAYPATSNPHRTCESAAVCTVVAAPNTLHSRLFVPLRQRMQGVHRAPDQGSIAGLCLRCYEHLMLCATHRHAVAVVSSSGPGTAVLRADCQSGMMDPP